MDDKNSVQRLNLVEKIPALDMALTVPSDGSQSSDQVGANNPCFIMCIDASGRLLRIPMSVLQKQANVSNSKINESHDKQKAPVATISPWITPTQNSQGNSASQLQQPILSLNRSQQMTSQQLFVDQTQQINPPIHLNQQSPISQEQGAPKLQLIGSQQQFVDKLQILMQKQQVGNLHLNVKNLPLGSLQIGQQKVSSEHPSNMQLLLNSNHCASLSQGFTKHQIAQQIQPVHHPPNNLQVVNRHQENSTPSLQKQSCSQTLFTTLHQSANIPSNLNLLAVLQSNKILQSKGSIQLLDQLSSHKNVADSQIQPSSSIPVKEEQSLQSNQNWPNQLLYQDSKHDASLSSSGANATLSTDKNSILEGINGKSVLALNSIKFKNIGNKVELSDRPSHSENVLNEASSHILASQQIGVLHSPNKASLLISNTENASLRANVTALSQIGGNVQTSFHLQSDNLLKDQVYLTQKTDFINSKGLEHVKPEKLQQSQLVFLENKGPSLFQFQSSKYATLSVTPSSNHGSNRSLASTFFTVTPQVQFSTQTLAAPQHIDSSSNQILKSGEGLKQVGNVQAIVIPNNISLNALQLPHISGLPLSNLSSIHIISSSGLSHDQVLFLPSHSSTRAQPAIVQTCPTNSARQLCGQMVPSGKQLQTPIMVVQSPLVRTSVSQEHLRQQKAELNNSHSSCSSKSVSLTSHDSGYSASDVCHNQPQSATQSSLNNGTQFTVGQEYQLSYPSGLQVVAVWDGKYFKVKNPANASVTPLKTQVQCQDNIESKQHQFSTKFEENKDVASSEKHKDGQQSYQMPSMDDRRFVICKLCGGMGLDHEACENCAQSTNDDVPNKKIRLCTEVNLLTQLNTQQLSLNKIMDTKRHKKVTSRKLSSASPKKDAEIVHILSSDDENHSSSWDDSSRIPNSPASASANCLPTTSSIPFSGFRVNIRKIFFGKISCDWMNTLTFDGKSVNILSDSCSVSYCLSACGSEVMLVAAYFDSSKHCTYLFLQVNHSSAIKLFDRIFVNARSLYDPVSKDDCAKYIVLFLDDNQTDLMEVIPRVVGSMQLCNGASHPVYKTIENFDVDAFLKSVRLSGDPVLQKESVIINRKCQEEDGDEMQSVDQSLGPNNGKIVNLFTYPPPPATGGITVTNEDLFCLNEGEFLNDVIIDFYFKYLSSELLSDKFKNSHIFSSFFYRRLTRKVQKKNDEEGSTNMSLQQRRHAHVKTWTRHVDLFSKDFVVVPINESAHWFLAIICYPGLTSTEYDAKPNGGKSPEVEKVGNIKGKRLRSQLLKNVVAKKLPCILVFDSLSGPSRSGVIKLIRDYLQVEWDLKKRHEFGERHFNKDTLKGAAPECPQQTNFSDCGIYILQYVESFFTDPITDYTFPIKHPLNWFDEKKVCNKRAELQQLILDMQKAHNPGLDFNPDQNGCIIKSCSPELSQMHPSDMT